MRLESRWSRAAGEAEGPMTARLGIKERSARVLEGLRRLYPDAHCELDHRNPFELLVATILSAQATDKAVNMVTPGLFARFPDPASLALAEPEDVEPLINRIGLFRNKAKSIVGAARAIVSQHAGAVPAERAALEALPGVGRKTANVVLGNAFAVPALPVDTHVTRLAGRLGLSGEKDAPKIERELMRRFPEEDWVFASHALIFHGRRVCAARRPRCEECGLNDICPSAKEFTS